MIIPIWGLAAVLIGVVEMIARLFYPNRFFPFGINLWTRTTLAEQQNLKIFNELIQASGDDSRQQLYLRPYSDNSLGLVPTGPNGKKLGRLSGGNSITHGNVTLEANNSQIILAVRLNWFALVFLPFWIVFVLSFPIPVFNIVFALFGLIIFFAMFRNEKRQYREFWKKLIQ